MKNKKPSGANAAVELRRQAEEKLDGQQQATHSGGTAETQRLIHELQVHQIELEMQNEELRRAQFELEASRARYFDIYDLAPVGYLILSEKSMILEANLTAASLLGVARGLLAHYSFPLFILSAERGLYHRHWKKLMQSGDPQSCELQMKRRDGSPFWARLEMSAGPGAQDVLELRIVLTDISEHKQAQQALSQSEDRLRMIFETMTEGIALNEVILDCAGEMIDYKVLEVNSAFYRIADFRKEGNVIGGLATQLYGMDRETIRYFWEHHRHVTETVYTEFISPISHKTFGISTSPFLNQRFVTSFQDITGRKKMEAELRAASLYSRNLIETSLDPLVTISAEGKITDVNAATEQVTGWSRERLIGTDFMEYFTEPELARAGYLKTFEEGQVINYPLAIRHVSGAITDVLYNAAVYRNEQGEVLGVFAAARDITERKRAEDALRAAHWRMESIIEATQVGAWEWNVQTGEAVINERWAQMLGYTLAELAPVSLQTWEKFTQPDDLKRSYALLEQHFAGELPDYYAEMRMKHKGGQWMWVLDRGRVITRSSDGKPLMMFGTHQDISARKQAEAALREAHDLLEVRVQERTAELSAANLALEKAARMKDEFLASMSHELRTPLTGILGLSEILQMQTAGPLNEKQSSYVLNIRKSGQHLLELINDILDLSKLEAGMLELSLLPCSLAEICEASLQMIAQLALTKNLQASFSMEPDAILLKADARRMKQILLNLLSNAVKFTPQGGSFGIRVVGDASEKQARITVWDTGIGIKPEDQTRLFQSFVQLDASLARRYAGSGLGLALARKLTELHGGSLAVESAPGSGSRFTVTLPWPAEELP